MSNFGAEWFIQFRIDLVLELYLNDSYDGEYTIYIRKYIHAHNNIVGRCEYHI